MKEYAWDEIIDVVPDEVGSPIDDRVDSCQELQVLGIGNPLFDQEH